MINKITSILTRKLIKLEINSWLIFYFIDQSQPPNLDITRLNIMRQVKICHTCSLLTISLASRNVVVVKLEACLGCQIEMVTLSARISWCCVYSSVWVMIYYTVPCIGRCSLAEIYNKLKHNLLLKLSSVSGRILV